MFQDATGTNDFEAGDSEEEFVIRTINPPSYLNNQSPVQREPSTSVQGEHQSEDAPPSIVSASNDQVSSDIAEQSVSNEEPTTATAPDLNQSNLEAKLNDEAVAQS